MTAVRFKAKPPNLKRLRREIDQDLRLQRRAAHDVMEIASKKAQREIEATMRGVGLGNLSKQVGQTSSKRKRQTNRTPYGVIFSKGGEENRGAQALIAYAEGAIILPKYGAWMAFPTPAVPRLITIRGKRTRLTPADWGEAGLDRRIGKLFFKPISSRKAVLVVRRVSLSPKTGQARALGQRKPRTRVVPKKDVVAFVLIKQTRRAKRFDHRVIVMRYADRVPDYLRRQMRDYERRAA